MSSLATPLTCGEGLQGHAEGVHLAVDARQRLETLEDAARPIQPFGRYPSEAPFRILTRTDLFPDEQQSLIAALETISQVMPKLATAATGLARSVNEPIPDTPHAADEIRARVARLVDPGPNVDLMLAARLVTSDDAAEALALANIANATSSIETHLADSGITNPAVVAPGTLVTLSRLVAQLGLGESSVGDLPAAIAEISGLVAAIENLDPIVADLQDLMGLGRVSISLLDSLCVAADLAAAADPAWRHHCRPGLHRHAATLAETAERQEHWQSRVPRDGEYDGIPGPDFSGSASPRRDVGRRRLAGWTAEGNQTRPEDVRAAMEGRRVATCRGAGAASRGSGHPT